ncbi:MAG TPA: ATP-binding protein [Opitutaceae bacterium]|jgi:signal transduction histidine kinase/FixJ family two-component response regulator|nr:ATP-binding protein [Opitutaceae bacterium]
MNDWLKQLIDFSGDYDYAWFIACLAWSGVAVGAWGRRDRRESWLIWLAVANMVQGAIELTLYANDFLVPDPYYTWDFALGLSQAIGIAALWWPLVGQVVPVRPQLWRALTLTAGIYLGVTRFDSPVYGGLSLALASAGGAWAVIRSASAVRVLGRLSPRELRQMRLGLLAVAVLPIISSFGPLAYAMDLGRRNTDFSPFELIAAVFSVIAAVLLGSALWEQRLRSAPGASESAAQRWNADLRLGFTILSVWMVFGLALAVANGRQARAAFEQSLLLRARTAAVLLDQTALRAAFGPNFQPEQTRTVRRVSNNGKEAHQVYMSGTETAAFATLHSQLRQLLQANQTNNAGRLFIWLMVIRDGKAIRAVDAKEPERHPWKNIENDPALADEARLAKGGAFLEGPVEDEWGTWFFANAAVVDTATGRPLGWLTMTVSSTAWATTFAMARLQAMFVTAIGVALWVVAVMFWLRRSERELALQQAEQSAAADRAKSQFLAQVSHELRAPLQGIYGYTDLIEMTPLDVHQQDLLTSLRGQSTLMLRLVNDLVDLGALQAGAFRLNPEEVELPALVAECLDSVRTRAEAKGLEISCQLQPGVPGQARTDGARLRQVLLNLLGNAVKYTREGSIKLGIQRCDPVDLGMPVPEWARIGVWVEFAVIDTGPGIAPEDQQRIFEPFIRLERDLAEQGAGLGLALTGRLCHALGGNLHVESDGEHGSSFIARLPLGVPGESAVGEKLVTDPAKATWPGLRVLVADDNNLMREMLCSFLRSRGALVTEACDGLAAVEECHERMFDVVLLDISMPWLDGHAAIQRLRAPRGARGRPWVIGLSAHARPEEEARAMAGGMDCFLVKPMPLAALAEAMFAAPAAQRVWHTAGVETEETPALLRERLLEIYARETPRVVDELRGAARAHDWPALRSLAHYLKNSADALGAGRLQRCCNDLQFAAETATGASVDPLLTAVELAANEPLSFGQKQRLVHA